MYRYEGPLIVFKKVIQVAYKLEFPPHMKLHFVFHISLLKPYHDDLDNHEKGISNWEPIEV